MKIKSLYLYLHTLILENVLLQCWATGARTLSTSPPSWARLFTSTATPTFPMTRWSPTWSSGRRGAATRPYSSGNYLLACYVCFSGLNIDFSSQVWQLPHPLLDRLPGPRNQQLPHCQGGPRQQEGAGGGQPQPDQHPGGGPGLVQLQGDPPQQAPRPGGAGQCELHYSWGSICYDWMAAIKWHRCLSKRGFRKIQSSVHGKKSVFSVKL